MRPGQPHLQSRVSGALAASAVLALLGLMLLRGFAVQIAGVSPVAMQLLNFTLPPPPPPPRVPDPPREHKPKPKGESAPPNRVSRATEVVAPVTAPTPSPVIAAKRADLGIDASSGAAPVAGPGTGAGGAGNGNGGGGGGGSELRWLSGELTDADYPQSALDADASGVVGVRFVVGVTGRVTQCTVTRSSGNAALDGTTCRLIMQRFRYEPSRNARGEAIPDTVTGEHIWEIEERPRRRR